MQLTIYRNVKKLKYLHGYEELAKQKHLSYLCNRKLRKYKNILKTIDIASAWLPRAVNTPAV